MMLLPAAIHADGGSTGGPVHEDAALPLFTGSASNHVLLLSYGGILSAWGSNDYGQLGVQNTEPGAICYPKPFAELKAVAAGQTFSLALDKDGTVWSWGDNRYGQLGRDTDVMTYVPGKISGLKNIVAISAGSAHALALDQDGSVWGWGDNSYFQLGDSEEKILAPHKIEGLSNISKVVTKYNHNLALCTDGRLFAWGNNEKLQCGNAPAKAGTPTVIAENGDISDIAVGRDHSCYTVVEPESDAIYKVKIYSIGSNVQGQLGTGQGQLQSAEPILTLETITCNAGKLYAGAYQTNYVAEPEGNFVWDAWYVWGNDCYYSASELEIEDGKLSPAYPNQLIYEPERRERYTALLAVGNDCMVSYNEGNASFVEVSGECDPALKWNTDEMEPERTYLLETDAAVPAFPDEYSKRTSYDIHLNFLTLQEEAFISAKPDGYTVWEYQDAHSFKWKSSVIDWSYGLDYIRPAKVRLVVPFGTLGENHSISLYGSRGIRIWNFKIPHVRAVSDSESCLHGQEDQTQVSAAISGVQINEDTPIHVANPHPMNDQTSLGLYLYGLPRGVTAENIKYGNGALSFVLSGNSDIDMDYDTALEFCYIYCEKGSETQGVIGDYDKNTIRAAEGSISGFWIKAVENTPETLKVTAESSITLGKEDGKILDAEITGGSFAEALHPASWSLNGCESSVTIGAVERIDDTHVKLTLAGKSSDVYDANKSVTVTCYGDAYADSREPDPDAGGYIHVPLSAEPITFAKQSRPSGGGGGGGSSPRAAAVQSDQSVKELLKGTKVTLSTATKDASIYYTLDGTTPTEKSILYTEPIAVTGDLTIKAIAVKKGMNSSLVTTYSYVVRGPKIKLRADADTIKYLTPYPDQTIRPDQAAARYEILDAVYQLFDIEDTGAGKSFSDVDAKHAELVQLFSGAEIIDGYPDGTFRGRQGITRAEFVKLLSAMLGLDPRDAQAKFSDTRGHWAEGFISAFVSKGYLIGYPDGTFAPDQTITRAEMVTVLGRITGTKPAADAKALYMDLPANYWAFGEIMAVVK